MIFMGQNDDPTVSTGQQKVKFQQLKFPYCHQRQWLYAAFRLFSQHWNEYSAFSKKMWILFL